MHCVMYYNAENEKCYSVRLYRTLGGFKVEALFCMCLDLPVYTKVCFNTSANAGISCGLLTFFFVFSTVIMS